MMIDETKLYRQLGFFNQQKSAHANLVLPCALAIIFFHLEIVIFLHQNNWGLGEVFLTNICNRIYFALSLFHHLHIFIYWHQVHGEKDWQLLALSRFLVFLPIFDPANVLNNEILWLQNKLYFSIKRTWCAAYWQLCT